jgi:imidazolonepropionase-like amidohydrolase
MKLPGAILLLLFSSFSFAQQPESSASREIVFEDVNIITMLKDEVKEHQTVVTKNGKITAIGAVKKVTYGKGALVVDGKGKYLMPGLAEMHGHVPPIEDMQPMKDVLALFAVNGITTVRGMLGHPKHLELRAMVNRGELLSPHFYTTGPSINGMSVTSPEAGAEMVRQQKKAGYDFLKMHPGLTRAKFDSIAATANKLRIPFAGHVSFGVGVWRAIEAGYSSIDHLDGFIEGLVPGIETMVEQETGPFALQVADKADTTKIPQLIQALKAKNIWVVPTQSLGERWFSPHYSSEDFKNDPNKKYMSANTTNQWIASKDNLMNDPKYNVSKAEVFLKLRRKLVRECQKNGVGILLGCDAPQIFNVPGFSTHNELEYLVLAGLTPFEALKTGTVNVAQYLKIKDAGTIQVGSVSDLILLNGNPLKDINQVRGQAGVMIGTKWMDKTFIDNELKRLVKQ